MLQIFCILFEQFGVLLEDKVLWGKSGPWATAIFWSDREAQAPI